MQQNNWPGLCKSFSGAVTNENTVLRFLINRFSRQNDDKLVIANNVRKLPLTVWKSWLVMDLHVKISLRVTGNEWTSAKETFPCNHFSYVQIVCWNCSLHYLKSAYRRCSLWVRLLLLNLQHQQVVNYCTVKFRSRLALKHEEYIGTRKLLIASYRRVIMITFLHTPLRGSNEIVPKTI